jgi:hypothetical protein
MSKEAGQTKTVKPRLQKLVAADFVAQQAAKPKHEVAKEAAIEAANEARLREESIRKLAASKAARESVNIAATKLATNDAFSVYADVDVDALQEAAIDAGKVGEAASRKETQMQVANILARYAQDKFLGDSNPVKLYTVQTDGSHSFKVDTAKLIARMIYEVPEKTLDGKKNPLPQYLLARVRRIAPLVFYAIQERVPLVWSDEHKALMVPTWMLVSDPSLVPGFWDPETAAAMRMVYNKAQPVDGKEGRTLDAIIKRVEATQQPKKKGTNSDQTSSPAQQQEQKLRAAMGNHGLKKTLELLADMFTKAPEKPFDEEVLDLLAVCCEHVNSRNGEGAMGKAVAELKGPKEAKRSAA